MTDKLMKITRRQLIKLVEQAAEGSSDLTDEKQKEIDDAVADYLASEGGAASEQTTEKIVADKVDGIDAKSYLARSERFKQLKVDNDLQDYYDTTLTEVRILVGKDYLRNEKTLNEGIISVAMQRSIIVALMALLDDYTGELSGILAVLLLLYKNVFELHTNNKLVDIELAKKDPDIKKLEELRKKLVNDVMDIITAVMIALPIPLIDTAGTFLVNMLKQQVVSGVGELISEKFKQLSKSKPMLAKILSILSFPFGGPVIMQSLVNIDRLSIAKVDLTAAGIEVVPESEKDMDFIDITPIEGDDLQARNTAILRDEIRESIIRIANIRK